ncbi:terminase large subunit, partial [Halalkalibacterium halodurans]|nr:terminase large subunit [Halalkalibacterium halodurans]MED4104892.1 terminase large subunit [Halalkalibacterium halodurans]MED4110447.1 terminase large subunit [Halalkalibacterium halodurans]MED4150956.1 terminase large subunit [Halalkalibacterium halodurans]MED4188351.1 terminase large subunit [Halalkalibacterium halodurans]
HTGGFDYLKKPYKTGLPYCDSNDVFIEEHKKYQFDEKTLNSDDPKVIKEDDHTVDEFQYFCTANARDLRLKV